MPIRAQRRADTPPTRPEQLSNPGAPLRVTKHPDGKVCFVHRYSIHRHDRCGVYNVGGLQVAAYECIYSGMWELYDPITGEEVGSIRRRYFERLARKVSDLVEDPDC